MRDHDWLGEAVKELTKQNQNHFRAYDEAYEEGLRHARRVPDSLSQGTRRFGTTRSSMDLQSVIDHSAAVSQRAPDLPCNAISIGFNVVICITSLSQPVFTEYAL